MDICSFWHGRKLRTVDQLCLSSMVMTGQRVKLFVYEPVDNTPEGVELHDAEPILSKAWLYRMDPDYPSFNPGLSVVQFSDCFRIMLMKHQKGIWLDTDVYLVKQFHPDPEEIWLARENWARVGVSALYLPPDHPIITAFEIYMRGNNPVPNWLGFKRRVIRPFLLKMLGLPVQSNRLGITIFGNDGISRLAKHFGCFDQAKPKETFYYWTGSKAERIFDPSYGLQPLTCPNFIGFHIHKKALTEKMPQKGSFYDWAYRRLRRLKTKTEEKNHFQ
ncbi:MAG: hypothetical protein JSC085_000297 [Candidatus Tokpelaia sp. JSC085]|nr:MAG: hypothetical protein JSC085_000297 [Candidatus Tokpelaia sp. JSC085]